MKVKVEYSAQIKRAAGVRADELEVPDGARLQAVIRQAGELRGDSVQGILFPDGDELHPSILVFIGDEQVRWTENPLVTSGHSVTLVSPVSGG
ncbi:MAG: MoaD/ThiS family protein [Planctomycetota bacterium]|nr:MoaD/ThiS family protein [Planctomycetota bacterium]